MFVVPVIDIKNGVVVHAVQGERSRYKPLRSMLVDGHDPVKIATALLTRLAPAAIYVADLDSINGGDIQLPIIHRLAHLKTGLWVDLGVRSANFDELAGLMQVHQRLQAVLATETLETPALVDQALYRFGVDRVAVSLDLRGDHLATANAEWAGLRPQSLARSLYDRGIRRFILLDAKSVGSNQGCSTLALAAKIKRSMPDIFLTTGGGVRDQSDLDRIATSGCDAALVATAIHSCAFDWRLGTAAQHLGQ